MPVVLTPDEVVRTLGFLEGEHRLFAQLLYGTGMRISEGLQLRVKDLDFDHGTIIVREDKGSKDRALMLPESLAPSLREQLSRARAWWLKDQAEGRLTPFFDYPAEIRKVIYTTNAIESVNMGLRKLSKNRGSFPSDEALTKLFYLALRNISQKWTMPIRDWKAALTRFTIQFGDRISVN